MTEIRSVGKRHVPRQVRCSGRSTTEVLLVFFLLILFGLTVVILAVSGFRAYEKLEAGRTAMTDVRTAVSFVAMKLRQNDELGAIRLEQSPSNDGRALVITEIIRSESYETWVWLERGKLVEALIRKGETASFDVSADIVALDTFLLSASDDGRMISLSAAREDEAGRTASLELSLLLRSGGDRP